MHTVRTTWQRVPCSSKSMKDGDSMAQRVTGRPDTAKQPASSPAHSSAAPGKGAYSTQLWPLPPFPSMTPGNCHLKQLTHTSAKPRC